MSAPALLLLIPIRRVFFLFILRQPCLSLPLEGDFRSKSASSPPSSYITHSSTHNMAPPASSYTLDTAHTSH
jgi:hypothetical protein